QVSLNDRYEIQVGETVDKPHSLQTSSKSYTVKSVNPDGSAVLVLTPLETIRAEIVQEGQPVVYDSSSGESPPEVFAGMSDLLGKPSLEVTVTPLGQVAHVEN